MAHTQHTLESLVERIFNLDNFDLYECYDFWGTIEQAKQGIAESITDDPAGVISWLLEDDTDPAEIIEDLIYDIRHCAA